MSLLYDAFSTRRLAVEVNLWPEVERFDQDGLSNLFAALNADAPEGTVLTSCELRPETGARFQSDSWTYDLSPAGVFMRCVNLRTMEDTKRRMRDLLEKTRPLLAPPERRKTTHAFYTDEIRIVVSVPEDGKRDVRQHVTNKLLKRSTDRSDLPDFQSAGLSLTGTTDDYHWHADINNAHDTADRLLLSASLMFLPSPDPPRPGSDLDVIEEQIVQSCSFATEHLLAFSQKFIS
ncbi:MAG TPA: hypothetical protein VH061_01455 [Solirubrobacteraceae bacterium]|jgi:hypothetical protein|nr:hypothetical protein [Solirubrobacteraceae bacterium]